MVENKWTLEHGIHRGTSTSRDYGQPQKFDTEQEAIAALDGHRKFYSSIGYVIWFSYITSPEGVKRQLDSNNNYR